MGQVVNEPDRGQAFDGDRIERVRREAYAAADAAAQRANEAEFVEDDHQPPPRPAPQPGGYVRYIGPLNSMPIGSLRRVWHNNQAMFIVYESELNHNLMFMIPSKNYMLLPTTLAVHITRNALRADSQNPGAAHLFTQCGSLRNTQNFPLRFCLHCMAAATRQATAR